MAFFDSDIVQDEAKRLFSDYQQLMQLGSEYGKFDREGKKKFIETMEDLMGRYRCLLYTSPSPRDLKLSRMPSSA